MPDRAAPAGVAPATEKIAITPEMLAAGVAAYHARDSRFMTDEDIVSDIFFKILELLPKER